VTGLETLGNSAGGDNAIATRPPAYFSIVKASFIFPNGSGFIPMPLDNSPAVFPPDFTGNVTFTKFKHKHCMEGVRDTKPWRGVARSLTKHEVGDKDGFNIVPAALAGENGSIRRKAAQRQTAKRTMAMLDIEGNKATGEAAPPVDDVIACIEALGLAGVVYTSHSHTSGAPRYRIALPLADPLAADIPIVEIVAERLGLSGVLDRSKREIESLFYTPRCPAERWEQRRAASITGCAIPAQWVRDAERLRDRRRADAAEAQRLRAEKREQRARDLAERGLDPNDLPVAQARAKLALDRIDVATVLTDHGYEESPDRPGDYRHPASTSGSYGLRLQDGDDGIERAFSLNGTDPLHYENLPAGYPKAVDVIGAIAVLEHGGDQNRAIAKILNTDRAPPAFDAIPDEDGITDGTYFHGERPYGDRKWRFNKLLPETGVAILSGQWAMGKTFVGVEIAVCAMLSIPFRDHSITDPCGVFWLAAEGETELPDRLDAALSKHHPIGGPAVPFAWRDSFPRLLDAKAAETIIGYIGAMADRMADRGAKLGIVIVDTLGLGAGWENENDSAEANRVMGVLKAISKTTGTLVIAIDHYGKSEGSGTRGSSAKEANADVVLSALGERLETGEVKDRRLAVRKVRGGPSGMAFPFDLPVTVLGKDDEGNDMDTCTVRFLSDAEVKAASAKKLPKAQQAALNTVMRLVEAQGGAGTVSREAALTACADGYDVSASEDRHNRRDASARAVKALIDAGVLEASGDRIWIPGTLPPLAGEGDDDLNRMLQ
jgi:hypothetical protein